MRAIVIRGRQKLKVVWRIVESAFVFVVNMLTWGQQTPDEQRLYKPVFIFPPVRMVRDLYLPIIEAIPRFMKTFRAEWDKIFFSLDCGVGEACLLKITPPFHAACAAPSGVSESLSVISADSVNGRPAPHTWFGA